MGDVDVRLDEIELIDGPNAWRSHDIDRVEELLAEYRAIEAERRGQMVDVLALGDAVDASTDHEWEAIIALRADLET